MRVLEIVLELVCGDWVQLEDAEYSGQVAERDVELGALTAASVVRDVHLNSTGDEACGAHAADSRAAGAGAAVVAVAVAVAAFVAVAVAAFVAAVVGRTMSTFVFVRAHIRDFA